MNIASIDIGTNTVLLLIAQLDTTLNTLTPLFHSYRIPRIGRSVGKTGRITDENIATLITILTEFKQYAEEHHCTEIIASGTYPFRAATNADDVLARVKAATGITITPLTGEDEAKYSFLGAISDIPYDGTVCVIDIGGGSTELITGKQAVINYRHSSPMGVVNFTEKLISEYPVSDSKLTEISKEVRERLHNNYEIKDEVGLAIALAGTPTTLACMLLNLKEFDEEKIHKSVLTLDGIEGLVLDLSRLSPPDILTKYSSVVAGREDVLLMGTIFLAEIMKFLGVAEVEVSSRGLRYGALFEKLKQSGKF